MSRAAGSSKHVHAVAIIPARFASTRFPGKPLARDTGKFLIQHVYEQVVKARRISRVLVATDDQRIFDAVTSFGGQAVMTRPDHASGTDRLAEVAADLSDELILNVQGDEPEIDPGDLDRLVELISRPGPSSAPADGPDAGKEGIANCKLQIANCKLEKDSLPTRLAATRSPEGAQGSAASREGAGTPGRRDAGTAGDCPMATLACPYPLNERIDNPNLVKVVLDNAGRAIYFSRSPIPFVRDAYSSLPLGSLKGSGRGAGDSGAGDGPARNSVFLLHRGLYAYRRDFLLTFATLPPGRLEQLEKLEQLRALEHGYRIAVAVVDSSPAGIDTPQQYAEFVRRCRVKS